MKRIIPRKVQMLVMACLVTLPAFALSITVKGKVTNTKGEALIGVTIQEKENPSNATQTDTNGLYTIKTEKGKTLLFSYISYAKQEIKATGNQLNVVLTENVDLLEECVVVGYGTSQTRSITGSIVAAKDSKASKLAYPLFISPPDTYNTSNTEEYKSQNENRFRSAKENPLSTFSLDVDAASYSNVRRFINQGQIPPKDAVRIEEMINYFNYDYVNPNGEHPVSIVTELAPCPWNEKNQIIRIGVKAKEIANESLPPANLVFLIDVSGSMAGQTRLELVKASMKLLLNNLRKQDRVAIVTYANNVREVLQPTTADNKQQIMDVINQLNAAGGTAGGDGIQRAYKLAEKNLAKNGNNRIVLCTDGDFNIGISSPEELGQYIESKRKTGIFLTVLGYGMGNYKDNRLQTLAEKGNGNHAYIDNIQEANKVLVNEFGGTMYTVAKDVKIQLEFNPLNVSAYRLIGYESRMLNKEDFNDDTKDAGDLGAGHTVTALYEIIPAGVKSSFGTVDDLKYTTSEKKKTADTKSSFGNELLTVKLRYKEPAADVSKRMDVSVLLSSLKKKPSEDFKFATAVAMFGQLLKDSDFKGNGNYARVISLAQEGIGNDKHGYKKEFIRLVSSVEQMEK